MTATQPEPETPATPRLPDAPPPPTPVAPRVHTPAPLPTGQELPPGEPVERPVAKDALADTPVVEPGDADAPACPVNPPHHDPVATPAGVDPQRTPTFATRTATVSNTRPPQPERLIDMTVDHDELAAIAQELRIDVVKMLNLSGSGHPGGSLGMADVFTTLWFGGHMNVDPARPDWADRDRFVLSNGHICPILYAILARKGYFARDELWTLRKLGSSLQGHPDTHYTPGVDCCTGSLGNGVSVALGMALGARVKGQSFRVYVGSSDGESQEGQVWEMASAAAHYGVDNLTVLIDRNGIQIDGFTKDVMDQGDLAAKYEAFGWHVQRVDGHDIAAIHAALETAKGVKGRPQMIECATVLGKGVSYMENVPKWHGVAPDDDELQQALQELGGA